MIIFQPVPVRAPSYVARSLYHRARWQAQRRDGSPQLLLAATCEAAPVERHIQLPLDLLFDDYDCRKEHIAGLFALNQTLKQDFKAWKTAGMPVQLPSRHSQYLPEGV